MFITSFFVIIKRLANILFLTSSPTIYCYFSFLTGLNHLHQHFKTLLLLGSMSYDNNLWFIKVNKTSKHSIVNYYYIKHEDKVLHKTRPPPPWVLGLLSRNRVNKMSISGGGERGTNT